MVFLVHCVSEKHPSLGSIDAVVLVRRRPRLSLNSLLDGEIVNAMAAQLGEACRDRAQLVVVCGKNAELREQLARRTYDGVRVQVEGFVDNMPEFMQPPTVQTTTAQETRTQ